MPKKVILFELNEVPYRILDEFARWRPDSTLARRLGTFRQYETHTEDTHHLSPWLTWPSLYRGVNDDTHQVFNFGQDLSRVDAEFPPLWHLLATNGVKTGIFGTLHTYPLPEDLTNYSFYIPDTFAAGSECAFPPFESRCVATRSSASSARSESVSRDACSARRTGGGSLARKSARMCLSSSSKSIRASMALSSSDGIESANSMA